ncbi:hypothetical protein DPM19_19995 [Actinomadura craniellae]|uniref:PLL-like beta propeller domain-containing protein n=1 Tax=Actinomadura craniellae TaxID=2231787 RepID=A0A365H2V0_9ACTN|nr:hypothetical protein [Actinomadura craniellae]RAY13358.1 hypothetical protein DPM19_19995 [Actinomadura craniellae]
MQYPFRSRRLLTAVAALVAAVGLVPAVSPAAAAVAPSSGHLPAHVPAYAADLPDLRTPQVAYDPRATQSAKGVAARGTDGALLYSARSGTGFAPFQSLGGIIVGDPSAVVTANGTEMFARGTDDRVYTNTVTPSGAITGYSVVPGLTVTGEVESVIPLGEPLNSIRIFARGPEGAVWTNIRRNGSWAGWTSLGGIITSDITASRQFLSARGVRIFVRGTDNRVYSLDIGPNEVTGFQALGTLRVTSNIAVTDDTSFNSSLIIARGEDNRLYSRLLLNGGDWQPLNGVSATSDPAASFNFVYVRGSDNAIYASQRDINGTSNFSPFQRVEGPVTSNPAAFSQAPNGGPFTQYLLARQPDGALAFNIRPNTGATFGPFGGYTPIAGPNIG